MPTSTLVPADFFALRTPLLPFDEFLAWSSGLGAPSSSDERELASALADALVRDPAVRCCLLFQPNSSLCRVGGRLHCICTQTKNTERSYHLLAVEPSEALDATLGRAAGGARLSTLAEALVDEATTRT